MLISGGLARRLAVRIAREMRPYAYGDGVYS